MALLEAKRPGWKQQLLADLAERGVHREPDTLFLLDETELGTADMLYDTLINEIIRINKPGPG